MRIRDNLPPGSTARVATAKPVARARNTEATGAAGATTNSAQADQATFLGLNETELSPNVRAALQALLDEVGRLRQELEMTRKRISHLERMADEDSMLPIANRRAFVRELTRMMSFAERYNTPASVIFFDVNGLKQINDTHGHAADDAAIVHVAATLSANIRDSDFVGRLGGDEFGVILPYTDEPTAAAKGATLAQAVSAKTLDWKGQQLPITVSYGAQAVMPGMDAAGALDAADRAMYVQKRRTQAG